MSNKYLTLFLVIISTWLLLLMFNDNSSTDESELKNKQDIVLETQDEWVLGQLIKIDLKNNMDQELNLGSEGQIEKITVEKEFNGRWEKIQEYSFDKTKIKSGESIVSADSSKSSELKKITSISEITFEKSILSQSEKTSFSFPLLNNKLFQQKEEGKFRITLFKINKSGESQQFSTGFALEKAGIFRSMWRAIVFKPIYNALIFLCKILPYHSLALAILILTLIIKLILLGPSKKGMVQQQKMQKVQKEIEVMRKRHAGDQQKIAQETMALWKKHKINPLSSILPMLLQFPIMIGLFYAIKDGLSPHNSIFLYSIFDLNQFDIHLISSNIFNILDLSDTRVYWLAALIAVLQFGSMKISFMQKDKQNKKKEKKNIKQKEVKKEGKKEGEVDQMKIVNTMMTYGLPLMVGGFSISMPAAVGFYWGISTLFSTAQQLLLNKEKK